jgi:hypothetical protein
VRLVGSRKIYDARILLERNNAVVFCHILQHYTDPELNELIAVAVGEKKFAKSRSDYVYREIQYHGEIRLDRDIASLHVNARHAADASTMKLIEEFRKRYKVEIIMLEAKK